MVPPEEPGAAPEPIAPLHNACCELAELKGQASELKKEVDVKKEYILDLMDKYDVDHYCTHGVEITRGRKATVKVASGTKKVGPDLDEDEVPPEPDATAAEADGGSVH